MGLVLIGDAIFPLFSLVLFGAVVYALSTLARRGRGLEVADPGIGTVRRLYFYLVSFVALMMAANGVTLVGAFILQSVFGPDTLARSTVQLASGISLAVVGLPLWAFHWRLIGRQVRTLPVETRSVLRKMYMYLVMGVSAALAVGGSIGALEWVFGVERFRGWSWAAIVVFAGVWVFHWRVESKEGQPTPETLGVRRLYMYVTAAVMLVMTSLGAALLVHAILLQAYEAVTSAKVLQPWESGLWRGPVREALAMTIVAGTVWAGHWLYLARGDIGSTLRKLYAYGLAVFGGIVTILTAIGVAIYGTLVWVIGVPDEVFASAHFRFFPGALASLIAGAAVLGHHWLVASADSRSRDLEARSVQGSYTYVLAGIGLVALSVAVATLVATAIGVIAESGQTLVSGQDEWRNHIALAITLGVLGAPLWWFYWRSAQRRAAAEGSAERSGLARRIFTFVVLGAGMLALLGGVSSLVFIFLRELLDGDVSVVLRETKLSFGAIAPAAVFLPYQWMVYREDRKVLGSAPEQEAPAERKAVTVLVSENGAQFVQELESTLGYRVSPLRWADPEAGQLEITALELRELAQRIADAPGQNVLLVPEGTGIRVLSYR